MAHSHQCELVKQASSSELCAWPHFARPAYGQDSAKVLEGKFDELARRNSDRNRLVMSSRATLKLFVKSWKVYQKYVFGLFSMISQNS